MKSNLQVGILLRAAALSIAPLAFAASAALADPPGYYFQDQMQPVPRPAARPPVAAPFAGGSAAPNVGENSRPPSLMARCG